MKYKRSILSVLILIIGVWVIFYGGHLLQLGFILQDCRCVPYMVMAFIVIILLVVITAVNIAKDTKVI